MTYASSYYDGSYRCVSRDTNVTAPDNSSQVVAIKVHCEYLKVDILMENFTPFLLHYETQILPPPTEVTSTEFCEWSSFQPFLMF